METRTEIEQIEELFELGCYMGPGERYLMLYEGILTITNRTGLSYWPKGNRCTIAIFDGSDCVGGLSSGHLNGILRKLGKLDISVDTNKSKSYGHDSGLNASAMLAPQAHPTQQA